MRTGGPRLIVFSGLDGAGKSEHARALVADLWRHGQRVVYRRLRFAFVISAPLLLYARLRGWGYDVRAGGQTLRAHAFAASPLVGFLYPFTLFLDLLLATWILVRLPLALGRTVVCDRFVLDSLIDVEASCEREIAPESPLALLYRGLIPRGTTTFLLTASSETLLRRRTESSADPSFGYRRKLYDRLAEDDDVLAVDSEETFEGVHQTIREHLIGEDPDWEAREEPHLTLSRRWYAFLKGGDLPAAAQNGLLLLTHWVFQSMGSMGRTERLLKGGVGIFVFLLAFAFLASPLGLGLGLLVAALLSHSANFVLNAQIPVVLKHVKRIVARVRLRWYANQLSLRVRTRRYLEGAVVVGSLARNNLRATSDLDVRIIPKPGPWNAVRAALFVLSERTRALWRAFPLDIYLTENPRGLHALRELEDPRILCDNRGSLRASFPSLT